MTMTSGRGKTSRACAVPGSFVLVGGFLTTVFLAGLAHLLHRPFMFPALGPTIMIGLSDSYDASSSPRSMIYGHGIGIACGYLSLLLCGLTEASGVLVSDLDGARILAAGLSVASTGYLMIRLNAYHPPAGSTTLIVSLGLLTEPAQLIIMGAAVILVAMQVTAIRRLLGQKQTLDPGLRECSRGPQLRKGQ